MAIPLTGSKWGQAGYGTSGGVVSWSFAQSAGSFYAFKAYISDGEFQHAIRAAFDAWEAIADIDFVEVADAAASKIRLGWDGIDGQGKSVAEAAWSPVNAVNTHAEIVFDLAEMWKSMSFSGGADLMKVALHEIGHTLGLGHADDPGSIMYPYLSNDAAISTADVSAIQALYGPHRVPVTLIAGTDGSDRLFGTAGADEITGGAGADRAWGLAGNDRISGGSGDDLIGGGEGNDLMSGDDGNDLLDGGDGNDVLLGGDGVDYLNGGMGNDELDGGHGDDVLDGGDGNDRIEGGRGDDVIGGKAGDDRLFGGSGDDQISGGAGDDRLYGGLGRDVLIGGAGRDVFVFQAAEESPAGPQRDRVLDFTLGEDRIDLSSLMSQTTDSDQPHLAYIGSAAFSGAGQVRGAFDGGGHFVLQANLDADVATAEFEIKLVNVWGGLTVDDLIL